MTDVMLPDISGIELARRALELRPGIKVIFASGNPISNDDALGFEWTALCKPFSADELFAAIRTICA
jgi:DNA-binding response OmpR family regulator